MGATSFYIRRNGIRLLSREGQRIRVRSRSRARRGVFASKGFVVTSTDLDPRALQHAVARLPDAVSRHVKILSLDLRQPFPFDADNYDVVYAHLSLHYFDKKTVKLRKITQYELFNRHIFNDISDFVYSLDEVYLKWPIKFIT